MGFERPDILDSMEKLTSKIHKAVDAKNPVCVFVDLTIAFDTKYRFLQTTWSYLEDRSIFVRIHKNTSKFLRIYYWEILFTVYIDQLFNVPSYGSFADDAAVFYKDRTYVPVILLKQILYHLQVITLSFPDIQN